MLKKVSDLFVIIKGSVKEGVYYVHPVYNKDKTVMDMFETKSATQLHKEIIYIYVWHESEESFLRGWITSCHDSWFIMEEIPLNELEKLDYLYSAEREDHIEHIDSMGVIYKSINNDTSK